MTYNRLKKRIEPAFWPVDQGIRRIGDENGPNPLDFGEFLYTTDVPPVCHQQRYFEFFPARKYDRDDAVCSVKFIHATGHPWKIFAQRAGRQVNGWVSEGQDVNFQRTSQRNNTVA